MHFVDGQREDDDLDYTNKIITDPGRPGVINIEGSGNSGGGCFIAIAAFGSSSKPM